MDETARKVLTGGAIEKDKINRMTSRNDLTKPRHIKHNTYTEMNLANNILSGSLALALDKKHNQRLPKSFYLKDPQEFMRSE